MTIYNALYEAKDKIPESSRLSVNKAVKKHADRIEIEAHFHHGSSLGGKSGSKFKTLPLDISEEDFNKELIALEMEAFEYFLKTHDN